METRKPFNNSHAVVIGGSIAGLLTGRVLINHFDKVTIIERDYFPETPEPRKGIPQSTQLHILLTRGQQILENLFPGLRNEIIAQGAVVLDMGRDVEWLSPFGWAKRFDSGFEALSFTRPILDWLLHHRLQAFDNLHFVEGAYVTGLIQSPDGRRVTGVKTNNEIDLNADLVVDASGYGSRAGKWLEAIGYTAPEETFITAQIGYASRLYEIPLDFNADWKGIYMQAAPPERTSMGVLYPVEGNRWVVGVCDTTPGNRLIDESEFLESLQTLPSPIIYQAVKTAKPLTPIRRFQPPGNTLRHYETLKRQPESFIALGDSVCSFTPIYGQGMTVAALAAIELENCLIEMKASGTLNGLAAKFQKRLAQINASPWIAATSQDAKYPSVKGIIKQPTGAEKFIMWYMNQVMKLTTKNTQITLTLFEVFHMLKSGGALFHPQIILQVLQQVFTERSGKI
jgi:2-polyprenyl-6-methoxyphenol hydroxylase-like FAD-dependent oxidoreductase